MGIKVLPLMALTSVVSVIGLAASPAIGQIDPEILREGAGARRDAVTAMELKPLDRDVWATFAQWTNGDPVTETDTIGKVVVFYTWSSFLNSSLQPMSALSRLAKEHGDDLVVIGVHHPEGWDDAEAKATRRRAAFPIAHDASGRFRELMKVDQDPDLYIVDRAGQLRYADGATSSVMGAVEKLIAESAGDAASTEERMAAASAKEAIANRRTRLLRQELELSELREVTFPTPSEEAYKDAKWPRMWTPDKLQDARSGRLTNREKDKPRTISLPPDEKWKPRAPEGLDGRLRLIYFMTVEQGAASGDWGAFYDEVIGASPNMRARLQAHDLLRIHDLSLDNHIRIHFPDHVI